MAAITKSCENIVHPLKEAEGFLLAFSISLFSFFVLADLLEIICKLYHQETHHFRFDVFQLFVVTVGLILELLHFHTVGLLVILRLWKFVVFYKITKAMEYKVQDQMKQKNETKMTASHEK